eukprot:1183654-Prorocentrum_minimum.AAC.3
MIFVVGHTPAVGAAPGSAGIRLSATMYTLPVAGSFSLTYLKGPGGGGPRHERRPVGVAHQREGHHHRRVGDVLVVQPRLEVGEGRVAGGGVGHHLEAAVHQTLLEEGLEHPPHALLRTYQQRTLDISVQRSAFSYHRHQVDLSLKRALLKRPTTPLLQVLNEARLL